MLTFVMPTDSRARHYAHVQLLVHAHDVEASWRVGSANRTYLLLTSDPGRHEALQRIVLSAHPRIRFCEPHDRSEQGSERPTTNRRATGRHKKV